MRYKTTLAGEKYTVWENPSHDRWVFRSDRKTMALVRSDGLSLICSCQGFEYRSKCKHHEHITRRIHREHRTTRYPV